MNILNLTTNNEVDIYETKINGMKISSEQITKLSSNKEHIQVNSGARYVHYYTYLLDPKVLRLGGSFYVLKVPITVILGNRCFCPCPVLNNISESL